ncbi:MAG: hypothetical protein HY824_14390 [Acidobacteria bacterium]|nr:hypothetical protein [Acidobacteriota bacterium]
MKRLLVVVVMILAVPLVAPLLAQGAGGNPKGVLGPVDALGQEVRRPPAPTGPPPRLPDGTVDLGDGLWVSEPSFGPDIALGLNTGETLPLLPSARTILGSRKPAEDPMVQCLPLGLLRYSPYPFRFIQNYTHKRPTHLYILSELMHTFRQVFMDGRTHPKELDPTWFGHSIGSYEKDTLVIDTVGFNDKAWFDRKGTPHTEQLHTVERWTRADAGHLVQAVTVDDPGTFSRPFTVTFHATLSNPGDDLIEYVCQENNQFGIASGVR